MKRYLYIIAIPLLLLHCKNEPAPLPAVREIAGRWRLDAIEKTVSGEKVWEKVIADPPAYLVFRFDGVPLDRNALPLCCAPDSLIVNGTPFKIKPLAKIPENPQCHLVDCASCSYWDLEQKDNQLILTSACEFLNYRHRYLRE